MAETMDDYREELEASFKQLHEGDLVDCTVVGISDTDATVDLAYNTAGVIRAVDFSDDPAFSVKERVQIGDEFKAVILRMDDGRGNILLSKKAADKEIAYSKLRTMLEEKTPAEMKITEAVKGGVVGYLEGVRAFVPASRLSLSFVEDLSTWVGKTIPVRVITCEDGGRKLVASSRELLREDLEKEKSRLVSNLQVGLVTEGTVETLQPYGAFVNIGNGLTGLLHVSRIVSGRRIKHPKEVLSEGDKIKVKVTAVKDGKISLAAADLEAPAEELVEEKVEIPKGEELTTSLGSLLKNIKL